MSATQCIFGHALWERVSVKAVRDLSARRIMEEWESCPFSEETLLPCERHTAAEIAALTAVYIGGEDGDRHRDAAVMALRMGTLEVPSAVCSAGPDTEKSAAVLYSAMLSSLCAAHVCARMAETPHFPAALMLVRTITDLLLDRGLVRPVIGDEPASFGPCRAERPAALHGPEDAVC